MIFIVLRVGRYKRGTEDQGSTAKSMLNVALRVIPGGDWFDEAASEIPLQVRGTVVVTTRSSGDEEDDGCLALGSRNKRQTVAVSDETSLLCHHRERLTGSLNILQADTE